MAQHKHNKNNQTSKKTNTEASQSAQTEKAQATTVVQAESSDDTVAATAQGVIPEAAEEASTEEILTKASSTEESSAEVSSAEASSVEVSSTEESSAEETPTGESNSEKEQVRIEFPYSEILRSQAPKAFEVAEKLATDWKNEGDFSDLGITHPVAGMVAAQALTKAKEVEKKLEEKGVISMAKLGFAIAKSQVDNIRSKINK